MESPAASERPEVGVVGPCGAGKSTLVRLLRAHGVDAREIAQEHSGVPTMWARLTRPRQLVYLEVSREVAARRLGQDFTPGEWEALRSRLAHAREHADLVVDTDSLTPEEICQRVLEFLSPTQGVAAGSGAARRNPHSTGPVCSLRKEEL